MTGGVDILDLIRLTPFDDEKPEELRTRIVELLRSETVLSREERDQIAELFDPNAPARYIVELKERKKGRPARRYDFTSRHIAWFVESLVRDDGLKKEAAIQTAMDMYGLSRRKVFNALKEASANK